MFFFVLLAAVFRVAAGQACEGTSVPFPSSSSNGTECVTFDEALALGTTFLKANVPPADAANMITLFGKAGGVDGLDAGVASVGLNMSLEAKATYPWAATVPKAIFEEYVAAYSFINEPRTNWRPLIAAALGTVKATTQEEAVAWVNGYLDVNVSIWKRLGGVKFRSSQTPLIFDPVSTAAFGYASCTVRQSSAAFVRYARRASQLPSSRRCEQ